MNTRARFERVVDSALANRRVATVAMARAAGIPETTFRRVAKAFGFAPIQRNCFSLPGSELDWRAHAWAGLHVIGQPAALTGAAALEVLGVKVGRLDEVEIVIPHHRSGRGLRPPVVVQRSRGLVVDDLRTIDDLTIAPPAIALWHLGRVTDRHGVLQSLIAARQREIVTLAEVDEVLAEHHGARWLAGLRWAREQLDRVRPDSGFEFSIHQLFRGAGLAPDRSPFPFLFPDTRVRHLDVPFSDRWVAFEGDTFTTHGGEQSFERDRDRWTQARRAGWYLGIITPKRLREDPRGIIEEARAALADADPLRQPPSPTRCPRATCPVCQDRFDPSRSSMDR